jgi:hypothetical protein
VRVTLNAIDDELRRLGHDVHIRERRRYFYFWKGKANNWLDRTVNVPKVGSLTLEQWIDESANCFRVFDSCLVLGRTQAKTGPASIDLATFVAYSTDIVQFRLIHLFVLTTLSVSSLCAGPVPITPGQLGVQSISGLTMNSSGVCDSAVGGCGGGFSATVAGKANVTLWCVDSQEFDKSSYTANIVSLNTPAGTFDES